MPAATQTRKIVDAPELPAPEPNAVEEALLLEDQARRDDVLAEAGLIEEEEVTLDRDYEPGDTLFDFGDGSRSGQFRAEVQGTPGTKVTIYDIEGRPVIMTKATAMLRLQKRYPANDQFGRGGMPVFYRRPPKTPSAPTFPCPSKFAKHTKLFQTEEAAQRHFQARHQEEWQSAERAAERDQRERAIQAQERQVALMERIVAGQAPAQALAQMGPSIG